MLPTPKETENARSLKRLVDFCDAVQMLSAYGHIDNAPKHVQVDILTKVLPCLELLAENPFLAANIDSPEIQQGAAELIRDICGLDDDASNEEMIGALRDVALGLADQESPNH